MATVRPQLPSLSRSSPLSKPLLSWAAAGCYRHERISQVRATEDLMRQITSDLDKFNVTLVDNFESAKQNMQKDLVELFKTTSKERLPDSFLMSLPKWGKNATKLHHIFSKSMNRKRTDTAADRREVPFDLIVQPAKAPAAAPRPRRARKR
eukprot:gene4595-2833_t